MASDDIAGSFFNPVPEKDENNEGSEGDFPESSSNDKKPSSSGEMNEKGADEFEKALEKMMQRRRSKPRASSPSTIGGVPTSKATGFGKKVTMKDSKIISTPKGSISTSTTNSASYIGIGTPDKPLNDINNPEYDDQGYTLYADERTGKKSRVFEALVDYPCKFTMKIVGANEGSFVKEIVSIVAESCGVEFGKVGYTERKNGKWISVTVKAPVQNAEMLYLLYENIDRDPRVKFKF